MGVKEFKETLVKNPRFKIVVVGAILAVVATLLALGLLTGVITVGTQQIPSKYVLYENMTCSQLLAMQQDECSHTQTYIAENACNTKYTGLVSAKCR